MEQLKTDVKEGQVRAESQIKEVKEGQVLLEEQMKEIKALLMSKI